MKSGWAYDYCTPVLGFKRLGFGVGVLGFQGECPTHLNTISWGEIERYGGTPQAPLVVYRSPDMQIC